VLASVLNDGDRARVAEALRACSDPTEAAADAMRRIRICVAGGGEPVWGKTKDGGEGWLHNPAYAAVDVPVSMRFLQHFHLSALARHGREGCRRSLLEWADFSLEALGGRPLDWEKLRASYRSAWSNRLVMLLPLVLRAHRETGEERY